MKLCLESGHYAGLVIAGFGAGHCSFQEADLVQQYAQKYQLLLLAVVVMAQQLV